MRKPTITSRPAPTAKSRKRSSLDRSSGSAVSIRRSKSTRSELRRLALLLQLMPVVGDSGDETLLTSIELAVSSLFEDPPNRLLAIRLRESLQQTLVRRGFLRSILPGNSASTWVIAAMATLLFVAIPVVAFISLYSLPERTFTVGAAEGVIEDPARFRYTFVVLVAAAGAVGSVVSILVRIRDFTEIRILNPPALFWTGLFKPIIGAAFALFVFCAFAAGLI